MRFFLKILVLLLLVSSCQDIRKVEKPKDLIPKDKMADILVELSLLQGAKSTNRAEFEKTGIHPSEYIWDRFDIDSLQFVESSDYYAVNYEQYEEIYQEVQARLEALKVVYDSLIEIERRLNDSLRGNGEADSLELREQQFRDSILALPLERKKKLPEEVTDSITVDSLEN